MTNGRMVLRAIQRTSMTPNKRTTLAVMRKGTTTTMRKDVRVGSSWSRTHILLFVLLCVVIALVAFALLASRRDAETPSPSGHQLLEGERPAPQTSEESPREVELPSIESEIAETAPTREWDGMFALDEVFDNPDCMFRPGGGAAKGTAAVVIPDEGGGSRFKILDAEGTLFEGELPFNPNKAYLGRSEDQSIVAGFGDIRLNSKVFRESETPEPVRIYRDGNLVYSTPKARQFALASNGSAFVTLEPGPDKTHVLKIRRFEPFAERDVSLGNLQLNMGNHVRYGVGFSNDWQDVKLSPSQGGKPLRFFPVDPDGDAVAFWEDETDVGQATGSVIPNRSVGYFKKGDRSADSEWPRWRVWKETYEWENGQRQVAIEWETHFFSNISGRGFLAHGGRYYIRKGEVVRVLNADTGELVFAFPTDQVLARAPEFEGRNRSEIEGHERLVYHGRLARERLRSVEHPDEVGLPGSVRSVYARDGELILYSVILRGGSLDCRTVPSVEYSNCVDTTLREHGARYSDVLDAFTLEGLNMDSEPARRVEYKREHSCARGDIVFQGLELEDGTFRFRTANALE